MTLIDPIGKNAVVEDIVRFEVIDPEKAREYLGFNTHNRAIRPRQVASYSRDILNHNWVWNGESVKFDINGVLLDGQHRLAAIVETGVPLRLLVIRGLDPQSQETMDGGAKRTFNDVLKLRGEVNCAALAASVRKIALWERGERRHEHSALTNYELLETLDNYPWVREGMPTAMRLNSRANLPTSVAGLLYWLFTSIDHDDAVYFFDRLCSDEGHESGDPIFELRRVLMSNDPVRDGRSRSYLTALAIKAWNKYRDGDRVGSLRFRIGGAKPEAFPEPR